MATRDQRLSGFTIRQTPEDDQNVEVLCEDNSGTYALPFPCHWTNGKWLNSKCGSQIAGRVLGWRPWR
jgi:hypothetical protein